jgi:hypothetical protein
MNYRKHYNKLIKRARGRVLEDYSERHHVKPRCLGGDDLVKNIVRLTPEEHYVAHQLLVKLHPGHRGLVNAVWAMSMQRDGSRINNKRFGWLRRRKALAAREHLQEHPLPFEHYSSIGKRNKGRHHSEKTKQQMRASHTNRPPISEETRARLHAAQPVGQGHNRGNKDSAETRKRKSLAKLGKQRSAIACENIRLGALRRWEARRAER